MYFHCNIPRELGELHVRSQTNYLSLLVFVPRSVPCKGEEIRSR